MDLTRRCFLKLLASAPVVAAAARLPGLSVVEPSMPISDPVKMAGGAIAPPDVSEAVRGALDNRFCLNKAIRWTYTTTVDTIDVTTESGPIIRRLSDFQHHKIFAEFYWGDLPRQLLVIGNTYEIVHDIDDITTLEYVAMLTALGYSATYGEPITAETTFEAVGIVKKLPRKDIYVGM